MFLCSECAAKVRDTFPKHELAAIGDGLKRETCGHCKKKCNCTEYEHRKKVVGNGK